MAGAHRKPTATARVARRAGKSGATLALGGAAALGIGAGIANAGTLGPAPSHSGGQWGDWGGWGQQTPATSTSDNAGTVGNSYTGPSSSLANLSHNQVPIQFCHDQVPVNVLGVQVPVQDATGSLGITGFGSAGATHAGSDASCHIPAAQQN
jgi:hypothetical protein